MQDREDRVVVQLRQQVRTLENDKRMLEKKLKFNNILSSMRSSTQINEEEIFQMKRKILDLERENARLRKGGAYRVNTSGLDEEIKTIKKILKNEKKMHEADLAVLSNLQTVTRVFPEI